MQIFVNDTPAECGEQTTPGDLLRQRDIRPSGLAIAVNDTVIPKSRWDTLLLREGDRLLIIRAVQGG